MKEKKDCDKKRKLKYDQGEDYKLTSHFDEGFCEEEEEYHPISEEDKEKKSPDLEHEYDTPTTLCTSSGVRSRDSSLSGFVITSNTNVVNSGQGIKYK